MLDELERMVFGYRWKWFRDGKCGYILDGEMWNVGICYMGRKKGNSYWRYFIEMREIEMLILIEFVWRYFLVFLVWVYKLGKE